MRRSPESGWAWRQRIVAAQEIVDATLDALPAPLRERAMAIPVSYEDRPSRALVRDGLAEDTLGIFAGGGFLDDGADPLPSQIVLFLDNLWEDAQREPDEYRQQVRKTLLHELGHYLGMEEADLEARGLE